MNGGDAGADRRREWIKTNQGVACCIAGVSIALLIYLGSSDWAWLVLRDGFRLGFFTTFSVVAMLLCALAMTVDRHRHETDEEMARAHWKDWAVGAAAMALCYIYFELAWRIDFVLVTPFFLTGATYVLGIRPLRSAAVAGVVITIVIYGLFRLLGIELPTEIVGL